jgi:cell division protein FtsI/penicillin-binding protein 2
VGKLEVLREATVQERDSAVENSGDQNYTATRKLRLRFYFFLAINTLLILVWAVYLFAVQMLDPHNLEKERQLRYTPVKELQAPVRGYIYDRNNEPLVRSLSFYQIDYDRSFLPHYSNGTNQERRGDYNKISEIIAANSSLSKQYVLDRFNSQQKSSSIYISNRIREIELIAIERDLKEAGLHRGLISEFSSHQRVYPKESLAARTLGMVRDTRESGNLSSSALSQLEGVCGIEATYNDELKGVYGWQKRLFDARNNPLFIPNLGKQNVTNGNSIRLTLDSRVQQIVEMNLREGLKNFQAKNGIAIFMDPNTGEILAMASVSESDKMYSVAETRGLPNLAVSFMFEPGSTLKPITYLAALEKKLFSATDTLDCRTYRIGTRTIRDSHPFEDLSFKDVLVYSSNVGTSKIADKIGENPLYERLITLGFGNRTGSDFFGESSGLFRKVRDWQGFSLHSISFGQEIAVTPIQLAAAYSALANNGVLMRPYIVSDILDENNNIIRQNSPQRIRTVSQRAVLDTLKVYMQDVVEYGTGAGTKLPYISIAGKTGTAEKQSDGNRGYTKNKYIVNFAGFFPVEDPKIVGVVIYDEPSYNYRYASVSAVTTFRNITEQILALPDCDIVQHARLQQKDFTTMPDVKGMAPERVRTLLANNDILFQFIGNPELEGVKVVNQFPKSGIQFDRNQRVVVVVDKEPQVEEDTGLPSHMPTLKGLTIRQAHNEAKRHNVSLNVEGQGVVYHQSIPPGGEISYGVTCKVKAN